MPVSVFVYTTIVSQSVCVCSHYQSECMCIQPLSVRVFVYATIISQSVCVYSDCQSECLCMQPLSVRVSVYAAIVSQRVCVCNHCQSECLYIQQPIQTICGKKQRIEIMSWIYLINKTTEFKASTARHINQ